jgi:hypothetical protein
MLNRRSFITAGAGLLVLGIRGQWITAGAAISITIYKSRTCGCCAKWVDHVKANGFQTRVHDNEEMDRLKDDLGVPQSVRSCHTAIAGAYLIEGHVPASDIHRLLAERPKIAGLAVPGMPQGSPGMAEPGQEGDYEVLTFLSDGTTARFASH